MSNAIIGQTYYSGNSFDPHIYRAESVASDGEVTVTYLGREKSGTYAAGTSHVVAADIFAACYFPSWDAMLASRSADPAPSGLLRSSLPGDR